MLSLNVELFRNLKEQTKDFSTLYERIKLKDHYFKLNKIWKQIVLLRQIDLSVPLRLTIPHRYLIDESCPIPFK